MPPIIRVEDQQNLVPTKDFTLAKYGFEYFNPMQSRVFEFYNEDANIVISARTGAGKTIASELIVAHEVFERKKKAIYLAPLKALTKEKLDDWSHPDHFFSGLKLSICTGDYRLTSERRNELAAADIIVMTNEMLSSRIRNYKSENNEYLQEAGVIIVDESHLITVAGRGDHQEVSLMKFTDIVPNARLVLLSATMPNNKEIAEWVSYTLTGKKTYLVDSRYRPCPLSTHYETYNDKGTYEAVERNKVDAALSVLEEYKDDKFLVFVHTKRTGEMAKREIKKAGFNCEFHSADLPKEKREKLEYDFKKGDLQVLVATNTLAWGCCAKGTKITAVVGVRPSGSNIIKSLPVEDLFVGNEVLSFNGLDYEKCFVNRVEHFTGNGYRVKTEPIWSGDAGRECIVSEDHLFYASLKFKVECDDKLNTPDVIERNELKAKITLNTDLDWICIKDLSVGDRIANCDERREEHALVMVRITSIEPVKDIDFVELEVDKHHNYISNGLLSHNCNLPARRVIIVGVHRGLSEVEGYDIHQEIGRSGRPGLDPRGDAYVLVPKSKEEYHINRLSKPEPIRSRLLDYVGKEDNPQYKTLAFHIVAEIHHGEIKTRDDVKQWHERTLGHFQAREISNDVVDSTVDLLIKCGAIREYDGELQATMVGKVASMFYYSPFDVADLSRNFTKLFDDGLHDNDVMLSLALGNIDMFKFGIVTKNERAAMADFASKLTKIGVNAIEPAVKGAYINFLLINGLFSEVFGASMRGIQSDFSRQKMVLQALDSMYCKWEKKSYFDDLEIRVMYGVGKNLVDLCKIPNVGKARAEALYSVGIRNAEDVISNQEKAKKALNFKGSDQVIRDAVNLVMR